MNDHPARMRHSSTDAMFDPQGLHLQVLATEM